jgi:hypothetical protein
MIKQYKVELVVSATSILYTNVRTCSTSITVENLQAKVQALGEISVNKSSTKLIITPKKSGRLRSKLVER